MFALEYAVELTIATEVVAVAASGVPTPTSAIAAFEGRVAQELTHDVYIGYVNGRAVYVGITKDFTQRSSQWTGKYNIQRLLDCSVTKDQARAIEQAIINARRGLGDAAKRFDNKINSISPRKQWYEPATKWADKYLKDIGIDVGAL